MSTNTVITSTNNNDFKTSVGDRGTALGGSYNTLTQTVYGLDENEKALFDGLLSQTTTTQTSAQANTAAALAALQANEQTQLFTAQNQNQTILILALSLALAVLLVFIR